MQGHAKSGLGLCPCASCTWLLAPIYYSTQDCLDLLQIALEVVFILLSVSAQTSLALAVGILVTCNLRWWCFSCTIYIAHLLMRTHKLQSCCHYHCAIALVLLFLSTRCILNCEVVAASVVVILCSVLSVVCVVCVCMCALVYI